MAEWIEGAKVIVRTSGWSRESYGSAGEIAKVYANGNFVLAGDQTKQQWRPLGDRAVKTGDGRFSHQSLVLLTPEVEARAQKVQAVAAASKRLRAESERLDKIARSNDEDAILAAVATLPA